MLLKWIIAAVFVALSAGLFITAKQFARRGNAVDATFGGVLALCSLGLGALVAGAVLWGPR